MALIFDVYFYVGLLTGLLVGGLGVMVFYNRIKSILGLP